MDARSQSKRLVVVGTGTGVGKTHLGAALARVLALKADVIALKPIESGVEPGVLSDAAQLAAASTFHVKHPAPYVFTDPVSPHLAARRCGTTIELARVVEWVDAHTCPWVLVETAGGLLSPLDAGITNLDLTRALRPAVVLLVGLDRLGVLHEISACCLALKVLAAELRQMVVVLQPPPTPDASTSTNAVELVGLGIVRQAFVMPRGATTDAAVALAAAELAKQIRETVETPKGFT